MLEDEFNILQTRKWLPSEYQDESIPPPRPTPSDWIVRLADGIYALAHGDPNADEAEPGRALSDGDIVEFDWTESLGEAVLTRTEDGIDLDRTEPSAPEGAALTCWLPGDPDSISESAKDLAQWLDVGEFAKIAFYCWSTHPTKYQFRAGKFVEVTDAP